MLREEKVNTIKLIVRTINLEELIPKEQAQSETETGAT